MHNILSLKSSTEVLVGLPYLIDEKVYEDMKDEAIMKLANSGEDEKEKKDKLLEQRKQIYEKLKEEGKNETEIADFFGVYTSTIRGWRKKWSLR